MDKDKWKQAHIPLSVLALKLCEEAAEVGTEITDLMCKHDFEPVFPGTAAAERIRAELDQVDFISKQIRRRLR